MTAPPTMAPPTMVPTATPFPTSDPPARPTPVSGAAFQARLDQPFDLAVEQPASLEDAGLFLLVEKVLEDSRCPRQVVCVWSGQVRLAITFWVKDGAPETRDFSTVNRQPYGANTQVFQGYSIKLVKVDPYPVAPGTPIPGNDYRITLLVSRSQ